MRAQLRQLQHQRAGIILIALFAAAGRGGKKRLPRRTRTQRLQRRLLSGVLQHQQPGILQPACFRRRLRHCEIRRAQAIKRVGALYHQPARFGGGQQFIGEARAEARRLLVQRLKLLFSLFVQAGAGQLIVLPGHFHQPQRLRIERQRLTLLINSVKTRE